MMSELVILLIVAGLVVLFWPAPKREPQQLAATLSGPVPPSPAASQTFQAAMLSLSAVRSRLLVTDKLDDKAKLAIESITHALVDASDK